LWPALLLIGGLCLGSSALAEEQAKAPGGSAGGDAAPGTTSATAAETAEAQRDRVIDEALAAIKATRKAIGALADDDPDAALTALERATGKLELIVARRPELALAPVDVRIVETDPYATAANVEAALEDIEAARKEAQELLEAGEIQDARVLVSGLASEIMIETVNLPLATYPDAIRSAVPLIDEGKLAEARVLLEDTLSTLVVRTEAVIPIPLARAEALLAEAEELAKKSDRSQEQEQRLETLLDDARAEFELAKALDYGETKEFEKLFSELEQIENKVAGGGSATGFFDRISEQLSNLIRL
jgi:hypothetical protein